MSTLDRGAAPLQAEADAPRQARAYPVGGVGFDLTVALMGMWTVLGLFIDGWAHNHGRTDTSFFTPWHAVLYSGMAMVGVFLLFHQWRNVGRGYGWTCALPKGYLPSLLAVVLFFAGGGFDFLWHSWFGSEFALEALLSPSHLLLAASGVLIMTGPLRAAWPRAGRRLAWRQGFPALLALLAVLSVLTFFSQYNNIFSQNRVLYGLSQGYLWDVSGISLFVVTALVTMFIVLLAVRRWALPFGAVTFLLSANALLMMALQFDAQRRYGLTLLAAPLAGLLADALIYWLRPSAARPLALWVFSFTVPFALCGLVLVLLLVTARVGWSVHMALGATVLAGVVGLLLGFLTAPPRLPDDATAA